jgi:hypothetical protein
VQALCQARRSRAAEKTLFENLDAGQHVANQWIKLAKKRGPLAKLEKSIDGLDDGEPGKGFAVLGLAAAYGAAKKKEALRSWVKRHDRFLRSSTSNWGLIGQAFSGALDDPNVVRWMKDWAKREEVESWMLLYFMLALRGMGKFAEANEVSRYALTELEPDQTSRYHAGWLAFDNALAGNADAAATFFEKYNITEFNPNDQWLAALTWAIYLTLTKKKAFAEARRHIEDAARRLKDMDRDACFVTAYKHAIRKIAKNCGGLGAWWWRVRRSWKPLLPAWKNEE